jgi:hypothetical protein
MGTGCGKQAFFRFVNSSCEEGPCLSENVKRDAVMIPTAIFGVRADRLFLFLGKSVVGVQWRNNKKEAS